jgi:hypothetical protein
MGTERRLAESTDSNAPSIGGRPNTIAAILVAVTGATLIARAGGGLYWLIAAVAASLVGGGVDTWLFLVRVPN